MELRHPIDAEIRARLKALGPNQSELARRIGRNQPWLNRYMNGTGHATIDDIVRIVGAFIGAHVEPLSDSEQRLLRAWRGLADDDRREDALLLVEGIVRNQRRKQTPESSAPAARTLQAPKRTERGTR